MTIVGAEDAPDGMQWVPTARDIYGELTDWKLVRREVAHEWDCRVWRDAP